MSALVDFAYAQARIQARYGERPQPQVWQQLDGVADFALYLEQARGTPLRPWVASLAPSTPVHELESRLRAVLRALIDEVAGWLPREWGPAVRWTAQLACLPVAQQLARGAEPRPWMRRDDSLAPWLSASPEGPDGRPAGPMARLRQAARQEGGWLPDAWLAEWRGLWPLMDPGQRRSLERLAQLIRSHLLGFARMAPERAWELRRALQQTLQRWFRGAAFEAAAAFIYLALVALDLERLRAALVGRALYPQGRFLS
ncbi:hypothetical protein [Ramlibacter sp. 2FC]|uniref:hypothetical protein n=1 Tax=Ramlibacter sp. 2FC TaxID=2502188 RepID=UPI0010F73A87|nr:hypothetical protein [Ramlibacter sp. 2FC]